MLEYCSCMACAYVIGIGCMVWSDSLMDIQKFSSAGKDLYLLACSELGHNNSVLVLSWMSTAFFPSFPFTCYDLIFLFQLTHGITLIFSLTTVSSIIFLATLVYSLHKWNANQKGLSMDALHYF